MTDQHLNHPEWTDLLSAYIDDELDPVSRRRVDGHLAECSQCKAVLKDLQRIVAAAPGYVGHAPDHDLWARVAAELPRHRTWSRPAVPNRRAQPQAAPAPRYRWRPLAAAALLLASVGGGWLWLADRPGPVPVTTATAPADDPSGTVAKASLRGAAAYDAAVAEMEATLAANRGRLDTATVRILEESLRNIDRAVAEARAAIQRDSSNAYLSGQINANLRAKVNVLRLATRALTSAT